ncbi:MAG: dephospho-CoA kinase [Deltaproteobacteria bacterium]|nr:dephospho-CoA kinase [Deltaproteobacteria bacterium]
MIRIGLTGGIGSGKSTVAELFRKRGAHIIDLDLLAHEMEEPGGAAWEGIVDHFGREILDTGGRVDREALGRIVFRDSAKREELNHIVHPAIRDEWRRRIDDIGRGDGRAIVISDVPLLIEVGWHEEMDIVILVHVPPDVQVERIMKRNGYTEGEARDRLRSQMPLDEKIPFADFVIHNEGTPEEAEAAVEEIWKELVKRNRSHNDKEMNQ